MRISQDTAGRIARAMTKKSYEKWQKAKRDVSVAVTDLYEKKIPDSIKAAIISHPEYFSNNTTIYLDGPGFGHNASESAIKSLPRNKGCGGSCMLKLNAKEADALVALIRARNESEKDWEDLMRETKNAILALGTHKKIAEHFPQAANLLPLTPAKTLALIPSLGGLVNKLKTQ